MLKINAGFLCYFALFVIFTPLKPQRADLVSTMLQKTQIDMKGKLFFDERTNKIRALKEIEEGDEIMNIPIQNVISSEEHYEYKEYFNDNSKQKLIGRLLVECLLENKSLYYEYIKSLPQDDELKDYNHLSEKNQKESEKRIFSFNNQTDIIEQRKKEFEKLQQKISSNSGASALLDWKLYNWANTIISCESIDLKKQRYNQMDALYKFNQNNKDMPGELCLVPGLNLFKTGSFKNVNGAFHRTNIYAFKDKVVISADRYTEKGEEVLNEIENKPNSNKFENCGIFVDDKLHSDVALVIKNQNWGLNQVKLCEALKCIPDFHTPVFVLNTNINHHFNLYLKIDQLEDTDDFKDAYKKFRSNMIYSMKNYIKSLARGIEVINQFIKDNNKSKLIQDIKDLDKEDNEDTKNIISYAINQKMLLLNYIKKFNEKLIKSYYNDIFVRLQKKYTE